jgi:hypothetical protein
MIYAKIDVETGDVIEFPYSKIDDPKMPFSPDNPLPEDAVEVNTQQYLPAYDWTKRNMYDTVIREGDAYYLTYTTEEKFDTANTAIEELNKALDYNRRTLNSDFQGRASALVQVYPDREIESWDQQLSEAKIYLQELTTDNTPLLANMATARQMDTQELATRIVAKADAFAIAFGQLLGKKHRNEDILDILEADTANTANWPLFNEYGW